MTESGSAGSVVLGFLGYVLGAPTVRQVRVLAIGEHGACLSSDPSLFRRPVEERKSEPRPAHDCPCCTCGMIELSWQTRSVNRMSDDTKEAMRRELEDALCALAKEDE